MKAERLQIVGVRDYWHIGPPLWLVALGEGGPAIANHNFVSQNDEAPKPLIVSLDDAFIQMRRYAHEEGYAGGYVLDFETGTIYYDTDEALAQAMRGTISRQRLQAAFPRLTRTSFSS